MGYFPDRGEIAHGLTYDPPPIHGPMPIARERLGSEAPLLQCKKSLQRNSFLCDSLL